MNGSSMPPRQHGASLAEFGMRVCLQEEKNKRDKRICPGVDHARQLRNRGTARARKTYEPKPVKGKDGTVYTPMPLPFGEDAA